MGHPPPGHRWMDAGRQEKEEGGKQSGIQLDHNRPKSGIIQMGKIAGVDLEGGSNSNTIYCKGWFVKKKICLATELG